MNIVVILGIISVLIGLVIVLSAPGSKASGFIILALGIGAIGRGMQQSKKKK